ncbi:hypothetical protein K438DRAFT_2152081 [Mycena galopus ATCC 62051]|nr:hypothetical protein K438DRAFT_2152081 [Mycena galopus ATCC 62051]
MGRRVRHCMSLHPLVLLDLRIAITLGPFGWDPSVGTLVIISSALVNEELARSIDVRGTAHVLEFLFHWTWPQLQVLNLLFDDNPSLAIMHPSAANSPEFLYAPVLTPLCSNYMTQSIISTLPRVNHISSLEVFTPSGFEEAPLRLFVLVATSLPLLEHLAIALEDIVDPFPLLSLGQRSDSVLHGEWVNTTLWSYFSAPALWELTVPQRWFTMGAIQDLDLFFARNGRVPSVITFVECPSTFANAWQKRHQAAWPQVSVHIINQKLFKHKKMGSNAERQGPTLRRKLMGGPWCLAQRIPKRQAKLIKKTVAFKAAARKLLPEVDLKVSRQKALHREAAYQKALQKAADAVIKHTKKKGQSRRGRKV